MSYRLRPNPPVLLIGDVIMHEWCAANPGAVFIRDNTVFTRLKQHEANLDAQRKLEAEPVTRTVNAAWLQDLLDDQARLRQKCFDQDHQIERMALDATYGQATRHESRVWFAVSCLMALAFCVLMWAYMHRPVMIERCEPQAKPQSEVQKLMQKRRDALAMNFVF